MMRKDLKLGLAIGGVFLAVLIVYMLAVSGPANNPELVNLDTQNQNVTPAAQPAAEIPSKPPVAPVPETVAPTTKPVIQDPVAKNDTPPAPAPADDRWSKALHDGILLATTTPDPRGSQPSIAAAPTTAPRQNPDADTIIAGLDSAARSPLMMNSSTTQPSATPRTHVVRAGENFSSIAAMVYGNPSYYQKIIAANPTVNPRALKVGMEINLPAPDQVRAETPGGALASADTAALDAKAQYRVEAGDSLYKISMKLYGRGDRADKMYDLNKAVIGPNKQALKPGMVLKLPESPTVH